MIHARIDTVEHRKILGFENGTRAQFDERHGGDPLWFFLDSYKVKYRANFSNFLLKPWNYQIDDYGEIFLSDEPPIIVIEEDPDIPIGYQAIVGRDGRMLKGADGFFLFAKNPAYEEPPVGMVYLLDGDNRFLKDPDGDLIIEPIAE
jgi:hypothetical protein